MRIRLGRDLAAPPARVFAALTDVAAIERAARAQGIALERVAGRPDTLDGAAWRAAFAFHGRRLTCLLRLVAVEPDARLALDFTGGGLAGRAEALLRPLPAGSTHLAVAIDARGEGIAGRLLAQSLRLAQTPLTDRLTSRLDRFAKSLEGHGQPPA